jgi:hypothetical protein
MCDAWLMMRPSLLSHISLLLRSPSLWVLRELVTACPHAPLCPSPSVSVTSGAQLCQDHSPGWRRSPRCALPVQLNQSSKSYSLPVRVRSLCRSSPIGLLFQHTPVCRRFGHELLRLRTAMCLPPRAMLPDSYLLSFLVVVLSSLHYILTPLPFFAIHSSIHPGRPIPQLRSIPCRRTSLRLNTDMLSSSPSPPTPGVHILLLIEPEGLGTRAVRRWDSQQLRGYPRVARRLQLGESRNGRRG